MIDKLQIESFKNDLDNWYNNRIQSRFPSITRTQVEQDGIVVYGCSVIGEGVVSELIRHGLKPAWIIDKNSMLIKSKIFNIEIKPIESLSEADNRFVLLASTHIREMINECEKFNVKWILFSSIMEFCPLLTEVGIAGITEQQTFNDNIIHGAKILSDEKSLNVYKAFIRYHYTFDNDFSTVRDPIEYFPDDLIKMIDYSRFIDAGAFIGDTLKTWLEMSGVLNNNAFEYWAFEPNKSSYKKLCKFISLHDKRMQNKIHAINAGIGDYNSTISTIGNGANSSILEKRDYNEKENIPIISIDSLFFDKHPTVIKADVEGYEKKLLCGAKQTIRKYKPTLMISVYHKFADIYEIADWIIKLDLGYKIYLRHAPAVFSDTVCYAVPNI